MKIRNKTIYERGYRWTKLKLMHINDSPHRIAMGVAIGLFIAWTPTVGFHIVLALALALLLRANKIAALVSIWINNPITMIPMFYSGYVLGKVSSNVFTGTGELTRAQMFDLFHQFDALGSVFTNFHRPEFWRAILDMLLKVGLDLWIGCVIIGIVSAVIGYFGAYGLILWHRRRNPRRRYASLQ
jgi:hypothetical protein